MADAVDMGQGQTPSSRLLSMNDWVVKRKQSKNLGWRDVIGYAGSFKIEYFPARTNHRHHVSSLSF